MEARGRPCAGKAREGKNGGGGEGVLGVTAKALEPLPRAPAQLCRAGCDKTVPSHSSCGHFFPIESSWAQSRVLSLSPVTHTPPPDTLGPARGLSHSLLGSQGSHTLCKQGYTAGHASPHPPGRNRSLHGWWAGAGQESRCWPPHSQGPLRRGGCRAEEAMGGVGRWGSS